MGNKVECAICTKLVEPLDERNGEMLCEECYQSEVKNDD